MLSQPPSTMAHFRLVVRFASYRKRPALAVRGRRSRSVVDARLTRTDVCRAESHKGQGGYTRGLSEAGVAHAGCAAGTGDGVFEKIQVERRPSFRSRERL